jgi:hypothetical protein
MYVFSCLARLLLAGVFLVASISKLVSGVSSFRKALADFGVPAFLVLNIGQSVSKVHNLLPTPCPQLTRRIARSSLIGSVSGGEHENCTWRPAQVF